MMVKAILAASHRSADVKVVGFDKLRFAVYDNGDSYKVYIFNSDFNVENKAIVLYKDQRIEKTIGSVGLEIIEIKKQIFYNKKEMPRKTASPIFLFPCFW